MLFGKELIKHDSICVLIIHCMFINISPNFDLLKRNVLLVDQYINLPVVDWNTSSRGGEFLELSLLLC